MILISLNFCWFTSWSFYSNGCRQQMFRIKCVLSPILCSFMTVFLLPNLSTCTMMSQPSLCHFAHWNIHLNRNYKSLQFLIYKKKLNRHTMYIRAFTNIKKFDCSKWLHGWFIHKKNHKKHSGRLGFILFQLYYNYLIC